MTCLIAYDIEDDKTRGKLSRYLEKQGSRMQKSVFVVEVKKHAFKRMLGNIQKITGKNGRQGCRRQTVQGLPGQRAPPDRREGGVLRVLKRMPFKADEKITAASYPFASRQ